MKKTLLFLIIFTLSNINIIYALRPKAVCLQKIRIEIISEDRQAKRDIQVLNAPDTHSADGVLTNPKGRSISEKFQAASNLANTGRYGKDLLRILSNSPYPNSMLAAAVAIAQNKNGAIKTLRDVMLRNKNPLAREMAAIGLATSAQPNAVSVLKWFLLDPQAGFEQKKAAATGIICLPNDQGRECLAALLEQDISTSARKAAQHALSLKKQADLIRSEKLNIIVSQLQETILLSA